MDCLYNTSLSGGMRIRVVYCICVGERNDTAVTSLSTLRKTYAHLPFIAVSARASCGEGVCGYGAVKAARPDTLVRTIPAEGVRLMKCAPGSRTCPAFRCAVDEHEERYGTAFAWQPPNK